MSRGVKFYSETDLGCGYNLVEAEKILENFENLKEYDDINTILEFYNDYLIIL